MSSTTRSIQSYISNLTIGESHEMGLVNHRAKKTLVRKGNMKDHYHSWECLRDTKVICNGCNTVTELKTLVANTELAAKKEAKVQLLSSQLYAQELRKPAHDKAYAWVRQNNPDALPAAQGVLI